MADPATIPSPDGGFDEVRRLLHTALYDTGSDVDDSGYWERTSSHAEAAVGALAERFRARGFGDAELAALREAICAPGAPAAAAGKLLAGLRAWSRPLIEALLDDPLPELRVVALHEAAVAPPHEPPLPPERWLSTLDDRHPLVRRAAIELLAVHARYASVPNARSLLRKALRDPDGSVRRAAMETVWRYHDGERNEIIASIAEHNLDLDLRQTAFDQLVAASHHPDRRLTPTMRDVLLRALDSANSLRRAGGACALGRYGGEAIARALCVRLLVATDNAVLECLIKYEGYGAARLADQVLPRLAELLATVTEPGLRVTIARSLGQFDGAAVTLLAPRLDETALGHVAVKSLSRIGRVRGLALLASLMAQTGAYHTRREIRAAIRAIVKRTSWAQPHAPSTETQEVIQRGIDV